MSENINLADKSQLALWQSYCDKKMECESLAEENQHLTDIATKQATRADELYEALKEIHDEAVDYQNRTGKKVTWVESVALLLEKPTVSNSNDD